MNHCKMNQAKLETRNPKGIIFDYGGTIDSRGVHWSEVIWDGYRRIGLDNLLTKEQFREAYVHGERELARVRHIMPADTFLDIMVKKMDIQREYARATWQLDITPAQSRDIATYCYESARACVDEARPVLHDLQARYPMVLVSNFYGNVDAVLRDFDIRHFFRGIIESAVVGVRKPNPTIFRLGVDVLEMPPEDVLVIGDSLRKDIEPAQSVGCQVLWLKGKGWTADEDAQTHPNTITSIRQVLDFV